MGVPTAALLAALLAAACSQGEQGVHQGRTGDPAITLSEGLCPGGTCPVYDMTLKPDGSYVLNSTRFVKGQGVTDGAIGEASWTAAVAALETAGFWTAKPVQTPNTMPNCVTGGPDIQITWRQPDGKEKTLTYNAACGVPKMQELVKGLRKAMQFDQLVWTDEKFIPDSGQR